MFLAPTSCRTLSDASCLPEDEPHTVDLIYDFIKYNFDHHSSLTVGYRAPFIIEIDLFWLSEHQDIRLKALIRFIEDILQNKEEYDYVYFVSIEQALEWLKYPRKLNELDNFWAFSCSETPYDYDTDCPDMKQSNETIEEVTQQSTSENTTEKSPDRQAEDLFRSDIVYHSLWIFVLLILTVIFYDKYFGSS